MGFVGSRHRDSWCHYQCQTQCRPGPSGLLGPQQWLAPYRPVQSHREMWFRLGAVDSRSPWHRFGLVARREETHAHGRHYRLLFQFEWSYPDDGKFHQGLILCSPQYVRLLVARIVERQSVVGVTLPRTYRFPLQEGDLQDVLSWIGLLRSRPRSPSRRLVTVRSEHYQPHNRIVTETSTLISRSERHTYCMISFSIQDQSFRKAL